MTEPEARDNPVLKRRELIESTPAPHPRHDAIVTLSKSFDGKTLRLRYVPDRDVLTPESLSIYLREISNLEADNLETVTQTILEDINDQIIPSWLEIMVSEDVDGFTHSVQIEDRQPYWKDRSLLDRLAP